MESIYSFISKSFMVVVPLTLCATLQGQYNQSAKLVSPDRESRAEFGTAVSINKDYAVIGASRENIAAGAAYIYKKNSNGNWVTSQKIVPSDGEFMAEFGGSMKLGNDFLVISAGRADINGEERAGALYVYNLNNNVWNFSQKLTSSDYMTNGMLGVNPTALDVYGNTIIAGSPGRSDWTGAAYIFEKVNNSWQQTQKINNPENIEYGTFGVGVAIHKDYLVVGASDVNEATGAAYIFKKNTSGEWNYLQKITASDPKKKSYFGNSVSIIDKEIVVGAYAEGSVGGNIAAAYIYKLDDNGVWKQTQKIASPISQENTYFGWMTKITSDRLYITSPHLYGLEATNIYIYEKDNAGQWQEKQLLQPNDNHKEAFYGWSIDAYGNDLIVGAPRDDFDANGENNMGDAGSAYIFNNSSLSSIEISSDDVKFFPNPVKDYLNITSKNNIVALELYNVAGQRVLTSDKNKVDVSSLAPGVYMLKMKDENGTIITKKIIKQ